MDIGYLDSFRLIKSPLDKDLHAMSTGNVLKQSNKPSWRGSSSKRPKPRQR